jgi:Ca2+-dependent lipid-binding protein
MLQYLNVRRHINEVQRKVFSQKTMQKAFWWLLPLLLAWFSGLLGLGSWFLAPIVFAGAVAILHTNYGEYLRRGRVQIVRERRKRKLKRRAA